MNKVVDALRELEGLATTQELHARGIDSAAIAMAYEYGRIWRLRKGLWCVPELPPLVRRAQRMQGRLACVSALVHLGEVEDAGFDLHISARKGRESWHPRPTRDGVIRHWSRRPLEGDRQSVSRSVAWEQFQRCAAVGRAAVDLLEPDSL